MSDVKTYEKIFANIKRAHAKSPIAAVFIQEHNIPQTETDKAVATALDWGMHLFIAPRPDTTTRGGTAIIMPRDMIQTIGNETVPQALARVKDSEQNLPSGRSIAIDTRVGDHDLRLMSAYAPTGTKAAQRPAFFSRTLTQVVNRNTILGVDSNWFCGALTN